MAELPNAASNDNLSVPVLVVDSRRSIITFTYDLEKIESFEQGKHYGGVSWLLVDGLNAANVSKGGQAAVGP